MKYGFDNEKYVKIQSDRIKERIAAFGNKLYMEFGGKLFDDYHASRVRPGFEPDSKFKMLYQMKDDLEIVIVISAVDIEKSKVRSDLGITYDVDVLRLRDEFMARNFSVNSVVITHYNGQSSADAWSITTIPSRATPTTWPSSIPKKDSGRTIMWSPPNPWWWSRPPDPAAARWPSA